MKHNLPTVSANSGGLYMGIFVLATFNEGHLIDYDLIKNERPLLSQLYATRVFVFHAAQC